MFFSLASCAALVSLVAIPNVLAVDIPVIVGGAGILAYNPPSVNAVVGDKIVFTFREKNHTATQSSLAAPCTKLEPGFDSGFLPVDAGDISGTKTAVYTVTSLDPVWVYCRQGNHCQSGMVFAVNAAADQLTQFQANAKAAAGAGAAAPPYGAPPAATSSAAGAAASSPASTNDHKVVVGGPGKLAFTPSSITAKAGDTITFQFQQKNHTVTQSTFANPCKSLASTSTNGQIGFDSGFKPVADGATTFPTWTLQVNDTQPIWAFCAQSSHCSSGMVFAVNTVESGPNTFDAFKNKATGAAATGGASPSGTSGSASMKMTRGAGFAGVFVALAVVFLL
jgi:plastocyanin